MPKILVLPIRSWQDHPCESSLSATPGKNSAAVGCKATGIAQAPGKRGRNVPWIWKVVGFSEEKHIYAWWMFRLYGRFQTWRAHNGGFE